VYRSKWSRVSPAIPGRLASRLTGIPECMANAVSATKTFEACMFFGFTLLLRRSFSALFPKERVAEPHVLIHLGVAEDADGAVNNSF
jgi:hypothetical protein